MKNKTVIFTLLVVFGLCIWTTMHIIREKPQKTKFHSLTASNSCLSLNYHRIRENNLFNQTLLMISEEDELEKYTIFNDEFIQQINWMKKHGAHFVTQQQIIDSYNERKFPKGCVWLSFDDADESLYTHAYPILKKYQVPATVFVIAGQVGNNFDNMPLASWKELKEMQKSGLIEFGSHTYNMHELQGEDPIYTKITSEAFEKDLLKSRKVIKKELGINVKTFAYPYGNASDTVVKTVERAGFQNAFILSPQATTPNNGALRMNRIMVDREAFENHVKKWSQFHE